MSEGPDAAISPGDERRVGIDDACDRGTREELSNGHQASPPELLIEERPGDGAVIGDILELSPVPGRNEERSTDQGYGGDVAFVTDGTTEVHLAAKDLDVGFRMGQAINPVERGHIAFRTDSIDEVKARLKERGISFSDYGAWAMKGWEQIFFHDPDGNIIEVHQVEAA